MQASVESRCIREVSIALRFLLGALDDDGFEHVGCVLGFVGGVFQHFVQFLQLDELDGIFFVFEEIGDGARLTLSAMSSRRLTSSQCSMTLPFFSSSETPLASSSHCRTIIPASSAETGGGVRDLVHHQAQGGGVYEVEHIVERGGQAVDVLAIERA